jgi:hypothetical protein
MMKRIVLVLTVGAMLLVQAAGMALAAPYSGTPGEDGVATAKTYNGTAADNILRADKGDNYMYGRGGDDRMYGNGGNDKMFGGPGNDKMFGGPGSDRISGGAGNDRIVVAGDQAKDQVYCGTGYDTVVANRGDIIEGTPAGTIVQKGLATACEKIVLR